MFDGAVGGEVCCAAGVASIAAMIVGGVHVNQSEIARRCALK